MSKIDFIIPVKNQITYTRRCIESILKNVPLDIHLILVDDASTDETPAYFEDLRRQSSEHVRITVLQHAVNQGYLASINEAMDHAISPYVLFSNNDVEVFPGAVEEMLAIASQRPEFGLINPNSNEFDYPAYDEVKLLQRRGTWTELYHPAGFFMMVKREVIAAVGKFDPVFAPGYFEEMDYGERARSKGFLTVMAQGAYVFHHASRTFTSQAKRELWKRNSRIFEERWRGDQWFVYLADPKSFVDPIRRETILKTLHEIIRKEKAYFYIYVPSNTAPYVANRHIGFRPQEASTGMYFVFLLSKLGRAWRRRKSITRIYTSNRFFFHLCLPFCVLLGAERRLLADEAS